MSTDHTKWKFEAISKMIQGEMHATKTHHRNTAKLKHFTKNSELWICFCLNYLDNCIFFNFPVKIYGKRIFTSTMTPMSHRNVISMKAIISNKETNNSFRKVFFCVFKYHCSTICYIILQCYSWLIQNLYYKIS